MTLENGSIELVESAHAPETVESPIEQAHQSWCARILIFRDGIDENIISMQA